MQRIIFMCLYILTLSLCNNQIESIDMLDDISTNQILNEQWFHSIIKNKKPVIIRNCNVYSDAIQKWNKKYLIDNIPELKDISIQSLPTFTYYNKNNSPFAKYTISDHRQIIPNISTESFFKIGLNKTNSLYPTYSNDKIIPETSILKNDLNHFTDIGSMLQKLTYNNGHFVHLWLSFENSTTHFHYDTDINFYHQIYGTKKWRIIAPKHWSKMHVYPRLHPSDRQSQMYVIKSLKTADIKIIEFDLFAGDVLYLPSFWFHEVRTISDWSASVNIWVYSQPFNIYLSHITNDAIPYAVSYQLSHEDIMHSLLIFIPYLTKMIVNNGQQLICDIVYNSYKPIIIQKQIQLVDDDGEVVMFVPQQLLTENMEQCNVADQNLNECEGEYVWNSRDCLFDFGKAKRYKHKIKAVIKKFVGVFESIDRDIQPILLSNYIESVFHPIYGLKWILVVMNNCFCENNPYWND
eukprot:434183_1